MLNDIFSRFDHLCDVYQLSKYFSVSINATPIIRLRFAGIYLLIDKVKTIGDCYMITSIPSDKLEHDG